MSQGVRVRVWGDYALFSRPEMKVERCSYDVITPSAARGILEAVYWHPGLRWIVDRIYIRKPICFTSVRRNELKNKISASNVLQVINGSRKPLYSAAREEIVQRASILLREVDYVIEAHFEMTEQAAPGDNPGKFKDIIVRRLRKGQCFHTPYLGCREFPARFEMYEEQEVEVDPEYLGTERDLGYMLYDFDYSDPEEIRPQFFRAVLRNGVLDVRDCEVVS